MPMDADYGFSRETIPTMGSTQRKDGTARKLAELQTLVTQMQEQLTQQGAEISLLKMDRAQLVTAVKQLETEIRLMEHKVGN